MKTFVELEDRLQNLMFGLDGDLWREMMRNVAPPANLPDEQEALDMVYRGSKALGGYIPDLMAIMRRHIPAELPPAEVQALKGVLGYIQLMTRILLLILLVPRYHDHEDLITTFNAYRQSIVFVEDYLAQAEPRGGLAPPKQQ